MKPTLKQRSAMRYLFRAVSREQYSKIKQRLFPDGRSWQDLNRAELSEVIGAMGAVAAKNEAEAMITEVRE